MQTSPEEAIAASADTMLAPNTAPPLLTATPPVAPPAPEPRQQSLVPLAVIGLVSALLLGAVGLVIGLLVSKSSTPSVVTSLVGATTDDPPATVTVAGPTVYKTAPTAKPSTPTYTPTAVRDPEVSSATQLRQIAEGDYTVVSTQGADRWVPQLSSKRPGVVDEGVV